jgi:hypothetical protein
MQFGAEHDVQTAQGNGNRSQQAGQAKRLAEGEKRIFFSWRARDVRRSESFHERVMREQEANVATGPNARRGTDGG